MYSNTADIVCQLKVPKKTYLRTIRLNTMMMRSHTGEVIYLVFHFG